MTPPNLSPTFLVELKLKPELSSMKAHSTPPKIYIPWDIDLNLAYIKLVNLTDTKFSDLPSTLAIKI